MGKRRGISAAALLLLALAGSTSEGRRHLENAYVGAPFAILWNEVRAWSLGRGGRECLEALERSSLDFRKIEDARFPRDCPVPNAVAVRQPLHEMRYMTCSLAQSVERFHREVATPLAIRHLGAPLQSIHDRGVRSCRPMSGHRFLRSEHAYASAIDVSAFELSDGTIVDVERDWRGDDEKARFLRAVSLAACSRFAMVISPDHDELHHDHVHLDVGLSEGCKVDGALDGVASAPGDDPGLAAGLPPCLALGPGETPTEVMRAHAPEPHEILSRLVYAEAHSTTFASDPLVHRALAWGVMNRVRLGLAYPAMAQVYGRGVTEVILKPKQFVPAVSRSSRYAPLFLCPEDPQHFALASSAARDALAGEGNPFIETAWERDHGLSLVVNFYYPSSPQARGPTPPWEGDPELALLRDVEIDGAPLPLDRVRFYRKTAPPE